MEFGISTYGWTAQELTPGLLERLRVAGFRKIELFANRPHMEYRDAGVQKDIARWFRASDVEPPTLHLPFCEWSGPANLRWISALAPGERDRLEALDETKRALEITDRLEVAHAVVHLGVPRQEFSPVAFEYAYTLIDTIASFAGIPVLIENLDNAVSTPARILEFLEAAQLEFPAICYDIGHDLRPCSVPSFDRVRVMHLNDNGGDGDDHALPFEGRVRWPEVIHDLIVGGFAGNMVLEARSNDLDAARDSLHRIEDLFGEAESSIQEFRGRHGIRRVDDNDLH